jgi:TPP-dependent pyruvate/acetoin dehydrogenase alpha subunit
MSIAGKWGAQKRKGETVVPVTSSSRDAYCLRSREEVEKAKQEPIARFRDTRLKNPMLLTYSKDAHMDESSSEDFKELNHTTTSRSMNVRDVNICWSILIPN